MQEYPCSLARQLVDYPVQSLLSGGHYRLLFEILMSRKYIKPLAIFLTATMLVACDKNADEHTHGSSTESSASLTEPGIWPPVLKGMQNVQPLQGNALAAAQESVIDSMRSSVMRNPKVQQALGSEYREFEASLGDAKGDSSAVFLFYNYLTNTTVEASFSADGDVQVVSLPASRFQPAEHALEVPIAIDLGKDALIADGYQLAGLTGTAMLAFPPTNALPDSDNTFYPERVLYVTFGPGNGELPEFSALVNLSDSSVINVRRIN